MEKALMHLARDKKMAVLIEKYGALPIYKERENIFADIVDSIISQQLSTKAASTILKRFLNLFDAKEIPSPALILAKSDDEIRACGISYPKIKYIKGVALELTEGKLNLEELRNLSDEEAMDTLIKLKGIGRWTAEMILMFTLARPDVFSMGDIGLRNAISRLYLIDRDDIAKIESISLAWSPYRTLACRYLWKSLDNEPKENV